MSSRSKSALGAVINVLFMVTFGVYSLGTIVAAPFYNWQYAQENGFMSWLVFGEIVATTRAAFWPFHVYSLAASRGSTHAAFPDADRNKVSNILAKLPAYRLTSQDTADLDEVFARAKSSGAMTSEDFRGLMQSCENTKKYFVDLSASVEASWRSRTYAPTPTYEEDCRGIGRDIRGKELESDDRLIRAAADHDSSIIAHDGTKQPFGKFSVDNVSDTASMLTVNTELLRSLLRKYESI